jgi:hypothetical protein
MKIISEVLGLMGNTTGTAQPEADDTVLNFPGTVVPTFELYRPHTVHPGFLVSGIARTSFVYGERVAKTGVLPADDILILQLDRGIWTLDVHVSSFRTGGMAFVQFFSLGVSFDDGTTIANLWFDTTTTGAIGVNAYLPQIKLTSLSSQNPGRISIIRHMPESTAGISVIMSLGINARKLT